MAIPSELVHPSFDSGQGLAILGVGVLVRKRTQEGLASLGGASGGPRAAGLAAWPSEGAVDLGLAAAQASRAVTAPPAEGWLAIGGRAAGWGRRGCWDAWRREARLFLGVPLADGSCWLSLVLSPYSVPARLLRTRPKGALRERFTAMSLCMETGLDVQGSLSLPGTQLSQWGGPGPPPKATLPQRWATRAHEEYGVFPGSA